MNSPLLLRREIGPRYALKVARTGRARAGDGLAESGLNCEIVVHALGFNEDQAQSRGALLTFEWTGPVLAALGLVGYEPNILVDQHPHRALVPVGTTQHLRLVGVELIRGQSWLSAVERPKLAGWPSLKALGRWLSSKLPGWDQREACRIAAEVAHIVEQRPAIVVVLPPFSSYERGMPERFPNVDWAALKDTD